MEIGIKVAELLLQLPGSGVQTPWKEVYEMNIEELGKAQDAVGVVLARAKKASIPAGKLTRKAGVQDMDSRPFMFCTGKEFPSILSII